MYRSPFNSATGSELVTRQSSLLRVLNAEIATLGEQQRVVVGLLRSNRAHVGITVMSRNQWTRLLEAAGFTECDMRRWPAIFEGHDPDAHLEFLRFLSIPDDEISEIRREARADRDRLVSV
jgi:hypothetical protein